MIILYCTLPCSVRTMGPEVKGDKTRALWTEEYFSNMLLFVFHDVVFAVVFAVVVVVAATAATLIVATYTTLILKVYLMCVRLYVRRTSSTATTTGRCETCPAASSSPGPWPRCRRATASPASSTWATRPSSYTHSTGETYR